MFTLFKKKKTPADNMVRDYSDLLDMITDKVMEAEDYSEIEEPLQMLDRLAELGLEHARGMYALALLRDDKPWYDPEKGMKALTQAAEKGEPCSQHMLGSILFEGRRGIPKDRVMSKYWFNKSAESGYEPALEDMERLWR